MIKVNRNKKGHIKEISIKADKVMSHAMEDFLDGMLATNKKNPEYMSISELEDKLRKAGKL